MQFMHASFIGVISPLSSCRRRGEIGEREGEKGLLLRKPMQLRVSE